MFIGHPMTAFSYGRCYRDEVSHYAKSPRGFLTSAVLLLPAAHGTILPRPLNLNTIEVSGPDEQGYATSRDAEHDNSQADQNCAQVRHRVTDHVP